MNRDILRRIKQSKWTYDKQAQKAALLVRKREFLQERKMVLRLIKDEYRKLTGIKAFFLDYANPNRELVDRNYEYNVSRYCWENWCSRWAISPNWDGRLTSLDKHIDSTARISSRASSDPIPIPSDYQLIGECGLDEVDWLWSGAYSVLFAPRSEIRINIYPETTLEDIRKMWPEIEKMQRSTFSYKAEARSDFGRDLCWYDLSEKFELSARQIAKLWIENRPDDAEIMAIRYFRKQLRSTLRSALSAKMDAFEDDKKLLNEIMSGSLKENQRKNYLDAKNYYLEGKRLVQVGHKIKENKLSPPFHNVVAASIKRIRKNIARL